MRDRNLQFKNFSVVLNELEWLVSQGVSVVPLKPESKEPLLKWSEYQKRQPTREEIEQWMQQTSNFAAVCGKVSGNLVIIDIDKEELFSKLELGPVAAKTKVDKTPHGFHIWLRSRLEKNRVLKWQEKPEIEIKTKGLAVIAGSVNEEGVMYEHFPTSPRVIAEVEPRFFDALEAVWRGYRGLTKKAAKKKGVRLKAGILEIIKSYAGELKEFKDYGDYQQCRCPLPGHEDEHPSFTIFKDDSWYCFGCQRGGDAIQFVSEFFSISRRAAKEKLSSDGWLDREQEEQTLTVEEIKAMEDWNGTDTITNHVIYKKIYEGVPRRFYVKVWIEEGEVKEEVDPMAHSIPEQTAPSVEFYKEEQTDFKEVFEELRKLHKAYVHFVDPVYPTLTTLGAMASYFREVFYTYPYFDFISGEPESGKTTAMKTMTFSSFYGTMASSVSEAVLFREIDASHCFYGLDNIERLFTKPSEYAGIIDWLLSSYSRDIPCRRLEKVGDQYEVVTFDGYGGKAFTHIKDFPPQLATLKSRCIQIVMQRGRPKESYPTPEKFKRIRDKLYNLRIREHSKVKDSYKELVNSNVLTGRTGDLFYPLLAIAKLISQEVYDEVLRFAKETEKERIELDEWNKELVRLIYEERLYGSVSPADIKELYEERLRDAGLLQSDKRVHTRTITNKLKKLGYQRDNKKTENKTWFIIDEETTQWRAYEYGIVDTPQEPNLPNLLNSGGDRKKSEMPPKTKTGEKKEGEKNVEERDFTGEGTAGELTKLTKLGKKGGIRGIRTKVEDDQDVRDVQDSHNLNVTFMKNPVEGVCERCGRETWLDHEWIDEDGEVRYICPECAAELKDD